MLTRFKSKFASNDRKSLLSNFSSLAVSQGANYILPLITLPYLYRVLGFEKVGLITFAQAFTAYFIMLTDYGFNLSATKEISINRNNLQKVDEIFRSVMTIKIGLTVVSAVIISLLVYGFSRFRGDWEIYFFSFGIVVGQVLFPTWFFQGMERMKYITFLNILAKLIFTALLFIVVKKESDYVYVPLINSFGFISAGIIALWVIVRGYRVSLKLPAFNDVKWHIKDGWHIFISRVFVNLYSSTNTIILGILTNNTTIGYYSIAEKISYAITNIANPYNQSIYPYLAKIYTKSNDRYFKIALKLLLILILFSLMAAAISFVFADNLIRLIAGTHTRDSVTILRILSGTIVFLPLGGFFTQLLIIHGRNKALSRIVFVSALLNFLIAVPLISLYGAIGLSVTVLTVQIIINATLISYMYKSFGLEYLAERKRAYV